MSEFPAAPSDDDETAARAPGVLGPGPTRRAFLTGLTATGAVVAFGSTAMAHAAAAAAAAEIPPPVPVPLTYDMDGVSAESDFTDGDFDGGGWAYPAEQLPTGMVTVGGIPFQFPAGYGAGAKNFVTCKGQTLDLPAGKHSVIFLMGSAHNGDVDASATVKYADGSTGTVPFRFTDWAQSPHFEETVGVQCDHRHNASGNTSPPVALFLQTLTLDPNKEAKGLTLPDNSRAKLISVTVQPAAAGVAVRALGAGSTELFIGTEQEPRQVVRVSLIHVGTDPVSESAPVTVTVSGGGVTTAQPAKVTSLGPGKSVTVDVGITVPAGTPEGTVIRAEALTASQDATWKQPVDIVVAEPGWTMYMVSHYHYDPVWWNTQGAFTETWQNSGFQRTAFQLVQAHLDLARRDPDYKFVLAEIDYLKPYWDHFPEDREYMKRLIAEGRLEYMGGMYNEPSPVLTSAELTIRNVVYGMGYQRDVLGGHPQSAWMLDVFGHDPQFPGICADSGLTSSSWARGPHHEWGPKGHVGANTRMQFHSEFDWVAPSGKSLLTSYMPNHYSAGWSIDSAPDLESAMASAYQLFTDLKSVAATKNTLLPTGTDHTPPNRWITKIHREWKQRYVWPRFTCGIARDFFDAVRKEASDRKLKFSPQTRDMNPVMTGCYVTYIDTKQAQRDGETTLMAAEKFATVATLLGARYPGEAFDKAWRQLCYGAHHDAITGSESDQVYLDLLGGWREALELSRTALHGAQDHIARSVDTRGRGTPIVVFNATSWQRTDVAWAEVAFPRPGTRGLSLLDAQGRGTDFHTEWVQRHPDGSIARIKVAFVSKDVPATGYATYQLVPVGKELDGPTWTKINGSAIENEHYRVEVDPKKGGAISRLLDKDAGKEMLRPGGLANELLIYDEYQDGPGSPAGGPWVTVQKGGPIASTGEKPADVLVEQCPIGWRITVSGAFTSCDRIQEIYLWKGVDRVDLDTRVDGFTGVNRMLRVRFQPAVTGGMPVAETAAAVTGRTFGFPNDDYAKTTWTLDYAANNWFELGSTLTVKLSSGAARAISVGEVIVPDPQTYDAEAREAVAALVRRGVTTTTARHDGSRYGSLDVDSNLPDFRISVGGPADNDFTKAVLAAADPAYRAEFERQLARDGKVRLWVPADKPLKDVWVIKADLREPRKLPVLILAGKNHTKHRRALSDLSEDLDKSPVISVDQPAALDGNTGTVEPYGFAVLNRGLPGFNIDVTGDIYLGVLRSSTGWPSGTWIDPPQRRLPDGGNFQTNHWSHTFQYSLVGHRGDWREAQLARRGHEFNNPLNSRQADRHWGPLPARAALLEGDGDGVIVTALKPRGNPMASQAGKDQDPLNGIVIRAYEAHGRTVKAKLRFFRDLRKPTLLNMLEAGDDGLGEHGDHVRLELTGFQIATVGARPELEKNDRPGGTPAQLAPYAEAAQPVYAQYWRHNKGAAPTGGQPLTVKISPEAATGSGPYELTVVVASERTAGNAAGTAKVVVPEGWTAEPAERPYNLAPGATVKFTATVRPASGASRGRYYVAAQITDEDRTVHESVAAVDFSGGALRAAVGARAGLAGAITTVPVPRKDKHDDEMLVLRADRVTRKARLVKPAGEVRALLADTPELTVDWTGSAIRLRPGQKVQAKVKLTNHTEGTIRGEAQFLTPYAVWAVTTPWTQGFSVPAGADREVVFEVSAPPDAKAGNWWAMVKLMYFGRLQYTKAVEMRIILDPVSVEADAFSAGTGESVDVPVRLLGLADDPVSGTLALTAPDGWTVTPASAPFGPVAHGESVSVPVKVTVPAGATPGQVQLKATATAAGRTVSTTVNGTVVGDRIEFATGTAAEAPWLFDAGESQIDGQQRRYADAERYWIYRFPLPKDTRGGQAVLHIDNEFLVQAGPDGRTWTQVLREDRPIRDGSNLADRTVDLTPYIASGAAYLRISDSLPEDGWGGRVDRVTVTLQRGTA